MHMRSLGRQCTRLRIRERTSGTMNQDENEKCDQWGSYYQVPESTRGRLLCPTASYARPVATSKKHGGHSVCIHEHRARGLQFCRLAFGSFNFANRLLPTKITPYFSSGVDDPWHLQLLHLTMPSFHLQRSSTRRMYIYVYSARYFNLRFFSFSFI